MKNILIITAVFPPEPVVSAQLSNDLARELSNDNQVTVVSPKPTRPLGFEFEKKKETSVFQQIVMNSFTSPESSLLGRLKESYSFGKHCSKHINENHEKIDLIYQNSWPLFSQYFIIKTAKKNNIPVVTHVMDIYPDSFTNKIPFFGNLFQQALLPVDRYILRNSAKIICISDNMKRILKETRNIAENKFFTVQNWQDEGQFIQYAAANLQPKLLQPFTFMYLGNNGPVAGVEFLIKAFVKAAIPNSRFIIAGSGSRTEACKNLVETLRIENIQFMSVAEGKVPEVQDLADVMLLPVKTGAAMSSIPSKLPAYMFSKKPVIGSLDLESDTARAILQSNCGIVVPPEDEEKLVEALQEISNWDTDKIENSGNNGFDYAIKYFSKKSNLKKLVNILLEVA